MFPGYSTNLKIGPMIVPCSRCQIFDSRVICLSFADLIAFTAALRPLAALVGVKILFALAVPMDAFTRPCGLALRVLSDHFRPIFTRRPKQ